MDVGWPCSFGHGISRPNIQSLVDSWWALGYSGVRTQVLQRQLSKVKSQDVKVGVTSEEVTAS